MKAAWLAGATLAFALAVAYGCGSAVPDARSTLMAGRPDMMWAVIGQQAPARPRSYWDKHPLYFFLDALILSSPLTAVAAVVCWIDHEVRDRPRGLFSKEAMSGIDIIPRVRRRIKAKVVTAYACTALSAAGVLTLILHLARMIPKI